MYEKKNLSNEQLDTINKILKSIKETSSVTFEDLSSAKVEINEAYLFNDFTFNVELLDENPENNAGIINVNDCQFYIHFGTLANANINDNKIFFPKNKIPEEYVSLGYDYLYLDKDLTLILE